VLVVPESRWMPRTVSRGSAVGEDLAALAGRRLRASQRSATPRPRMGRRAPAV